MRLSPLILPALISTALLGACNSGGPTYITADAPTVARLDVSATGKSDVAPDRAIVSAGTVSQGKTAREAMMANATLMTAVFDEMDAAGIARANITTSQLSLQPQYDYRDRQAPRITRYEARNVVTVKTDDIGTVGTLLDALVKAGVNNINQVQFTVKDPKAARDTARTDAIAEARDKAQAMADAAGVKLGPLLSLSEAGGTYITPMPVMGMRMAELSDSSTPVSGGEQTLSVTVELSYAIED